MAYIKTEQVKAIRQKLAEKFPSKKGWKLSVTRENYSKVQVCIIEAPVRFTEREYEQVNIYYTDRYENGAILKEMADICNTGNFDHSDASIDYFHVGWYVGLSVGKWDRPFVLNIK